MCGRTHRLTDPLVMEIGGWDKILPRCARPVSDSLPQQKVALTCFGTAHFSLLSGDDWVFRREARAWC